MPREWSEEAEDAFERVAKEVYEYLHELREQAKAAAARAPEPTLTFEEPATVLYERAREQRRDALIELTVALLGNSKIVADNDADEIAAGALKLLLAIEQRADPAFVEAHADEQPFTPRVTQEQAHTIALAADFAARCERIKTPEDVIDLGDDGVVDAAKLSATTVRALLEIIGALA